MIHCKHESPFTSNTVLCLKLTFSDSAAQLNVAYPCVVHAVICAVDWCMMIVNDLSHGSVSSSSFAREFKFLHIHL